MPPSPSHKGRILIVSVAVMLVIAVAAGLYAFLGRSKERAGVEGAFALGPGYVSYRTTVQGPDFGKVVEVPVGGLAAGAAASASASTSTSTLSPKAPPVVSKIKCERSYTAAGTLLCLESEGAVVTTTYAVVYDSSFKQVKKVEITGLSNRARLSPDGRVAAWTTFVSGDAYVGPAFSTRTSILDLKTGSYTPSLETFAATVDGKPYKAVDMNFWGVTMAGDDNTFYATLGSGGKTWLMRGDFAAHTLTSVLENVECPSLSPDGTRIVFKKRVSGDIRRPWRLEVLDLATLAETPLAETHSVDDQAAWLDGHTVMYALPHADDPGYDLWSVPADGSGQPAMLAANGMSPAATSG